MKVTKLEFTCEDEVTGEQYLRTLEKPEDVETWYRWQNEMCQYLADNGVNYQWHLLRWKQEPIKTTKTKKKLLDEILEAK